MPREMCFYWLAVILNPRAYYHTIPSRSYRIIVGLFRVGISEKSFSASSFPTEFPEHFHFFENNAKILNGVLDLRSYST